MAIFNPMAWFLLGVFLCMLTSFQVPSIIFVYTGLHDGAIRNPYGRGGVWDGQPWRHLSVAFQCANSAAQMVSSTPEGQPDRHPDLLGGIYIQLQSISQ